MASSTDAARARAQLSLSASRSETPLISIRLVFPARENQARSADGESGGYGPTHLALHVAVRRSLIQPLDLFGIHRSLVLREEHICFVMVLEPLRRERGAASQKDDAHRPTNRDHIGQLGCGGYTAEGEGADDSQQRPDCQRRGGIVHRVRNGPIYADRNLSYNLSIGQNFIGKLNSVNEVDFGESNPAKLHKKPSFGSC